MDELMKHLNLDHGWMSLFILFFILFKNKLLNKKGFQKLCINLLLK
jgi:hypothetical protein